MLTAFSITNAWRDRYAYRIDHPQPITSVLLEGLSGYIFTAFRPFSQHAQAAHAGKHVSSQLSRLFDCRAYDSAIYDCGVTAGNLRVRVLPRPYWIITAFALQRFSGDLSI